MIKLSRDSTISLASGMALAFLTLLSASVARSLGVKIALATEFCLVVIAFLLGMLVTGQFFFRLKERELKAEIADFKRRSQQGQAVLDNTPNGVLAIRSDGVITICNAALERMFGKASSELMGKKIEDVDLHPELALLAYECVSSDTAMVSELKLPGWPVRVLSIRACAVRESAEGPDSALLIIQDHSDIRRRQMHEREFVGNVSHELRTPITSVLTTAETLLAGAKNDPDVVDKFLGTIISESKRLSLLIEDLLEITKRDYGIIKSRIDECLVAELLDKAMSAVRPLATARNVEIAVSVESGLTAFCDEIQIVQLIRNLIDNAVKYTPEGGHVNVVAREEGSQLVISISDTGIGIPHGEIDRIFERFYRVDKARSRRMGGTGLGLAIVKDIVDTCGGSITVDTQLGSGSTFAVSMPMRRDSRSAEHAEGPTH